MAYRRELLIALLSFLFAAFTFTGVSALPSVSTPGEEMPFVVANQAVNVEIVNHLARTTVVQEIVNTSEQDLPCYIDLKMPEGAHATSLSAIVDGKHYRGRIEDKRVARKIVEKSREDKKAAALAEERPGGILHVELSQVRAGQQFLFRVTYVEQAQFSDGAFNYYFGLRGASKAVDEATNTTMAVRFNCSIPITDIALKPDIFSEDGPMTFTAVLNEIKDAVHLSWKLGLVPGKPVVMLKDEANEDPYFCLLGLPPEAPEINTGRSVVLILDKSGSMSGQKFELACQALKDFVGNLNEKDLVNIIIFDTNNTSCSPFPFKADAEGKKAATDFIDKFQAGGGTRFLEPLSNAIKGLHLDENHVPAVVLLTDGEDNVDTAATFIRRLQAEKAFDIPIFTFAIGKSVNYALLRSLAGYSGAALGKIDHDKDIKPAMEKISRRFDHLLATGFSVSTADMAGYQKYPIKQARIYGTEPVIIYGRLDDEKDIKLTCGADTRAGKWLEELDISTVGERTDCDFLDNMWAAKRMQALEDKTYVFGLKPELKREIVRLSKRYLMTSPYTSLVFSEASYDISPEMLDEEPTMDTGRRLRSRPAANTKSLAKKGYAGGAGGAAPANSKNDKFQAEEDEHARKPIPLLTDGNVVQDTAGKPLDNQFAAHAYLFSANAQAFARSSAAGDAKQAERYKAEAMKSLKKLQLKRNGDSFGDDLLLNAVIAAGLARLGEDDKLFAYLGGVDYSQAFKDKGEEYVVLTALYLSHVVKLSKAARKAVAKAVKSRMGMDMTESPVGRDITYIKNWMKWFPVALMLSSSFEIEVIKGDRAQQLLLLALSSHNREHFSSPDIAWGLSLKWLLEFGDDAWDAHAKKVKSAANSALANACSKDESLVYKVLGSRITAIIAR